MVNIISYLLAAVYAIGTIRTALGLGPIDIGRNVWQLELPKSGKVIAFIMFVPAMAASVAIRVGRRFLVWALFSASKTLTEAVGSDVAATASEA